HSCRTTWRPSTPAAARGAPRRSWPNSRNPASPAFAREAPRQGISGLLDARGDLLVAADRPEVLVLQSVFRQEFHERLVLVLAPARVVEVLVEHDQRARLDAWGEQLEDGPGRRVEVAVDVEQRDVARVCVEEGGQGFVEPADDQLHVVADGRQ